MGWNDKPVARAILRWALLALLVPVGLVLVAEPIGILVLKDDYALIDDTRAWLGAGRSAEEDAGVPVVGGVSCTKQYRSFRSTDRGAGFASWDCSLYLAPAGIRQVPKDDPFAGRSWEDGMAEWSRRTTLQMELVAARSRLGSIERALVTNRTSEAPKDLPALRRLSDADERPPRYGVVWGAGELSLRWLSWLLTSALFFGLGGGALYVAWKGRKW